MADNGGFVPAGGDMEKHQAMRALHSTTARLGGTFTSKRSVVLLTSGFMLGVEKRGHYSSVPGDEQWVTAVDHKTGLRYGGRCNVRTMAVELAPIEATAPRSDRPAYSCFPAVMEMLAGQPDALDLVVAELVVAQDVAPVGYGTAEAQADCMETVLQLEHPDYDDAFQLFPFTALSGGTLETETELDSEPIAHVNGQPEQENDIPDGCTC